MFKLKKSILFLFCLFFTYSCFCNPFRRLFDAVKREIFNRKIDREHMSIIKTGNEEYYSEKSNKYYQKKKTNLIFYGEYVDSETMQKAKKENFYICELSKYFPDLMIFVSGYQFNEILTVKDCLLTVEYFFRNNNIVYAWFYLCYLFNDINKFMLEKNMSDLNRKIIIQLLYNFLVNLNNQQFLLEALKNELFVNSFWK